MGNAQFREQNRRQYLQWGWEIAGGVAALLWWQWQAWAVWMPPVERVGARAVALAQLASALFPTEMLSRMSITVDSLGHISTIAAVLQVVHQPQYTGLVHQAWLYLCLPPVAGLVVAVALLVAAARLRKAKEGQEHIRGASIDDQT